MSTHKYTSKWGNIVSTALHTWSPPSCHASLPEISAVTVLSLNPKAHKSPSKLCLTTDLLLHTIEGPEIEFQDWLIWILSTRTEFHPVTTPPAICRIIFSLSLASSAGAGWLPGTIKATHYIVLSQGEKARSFSRLSQELEELYKSWW